MKVKRLGLQPFVMFCLLASTCACANTQQVKIVSDTAKFEQATGQATYKGKVTLTDQHHKLIADNLVVFKDKDGNLVKVEATGTPAKFTGKLPNEEQTVYANAQKITLYPQTALLKLVGDANINYKNDSFNGPLLEYHYKEHVIIANSTPNQRPSITLETPKIESDGK